MIQIPTQEEYNLSKVNFRTQYVRVDLLDFNFNKVEELSGFTVNPPTFSNTNSSDIRRSCNITLIPTDMSFDVKSGAKIWLDKYIQIFIGHKSPLNQEICYTNMGIYLINNPTRMYSETENTIEIQGIDLMAKLTGLRNGNLIGLEHIIPQGTNVRQAIIGVLELCNFTDYVVAECETSVPNDINIHVGGTAYDILRELNNILPNYQMYFDVNGVFHYNKVPIGTNEQIMANDDIWKSNLISYQQSIDFESVKNSIEVVGKTHDIKNYIGVLTEDDVIGNTYMAQLSSVEELYNNMKIGFVTDVDIGSVKYLQINTKKSIVNESTGEVTIVDIVKKCPIQNADGSTPVFTGEPQNYYVVKFKKEETHFEFRNIDKLARIRPTIIIDDNTFWVQETIDREYFDAEYITFRTPPSGCENIGLPYLKKGNLEKIPIDPTVEIKNDTVYTVRLTKIQEPKEYFEYMGQITPYAKIQETDPENPFNINSSLGVINKVYSGGEYDNIFTDDLALQRAKWELYQSCRLQDTISLTCVPIYWLDVNWLIEITLPNKYGIETTEKYMIQSINISDSMTINLSKYYPYYEE